MSVPNATPPSAPRSMLRIAASVIVLVVVASIGTGCSQSDPDAPVADITEAPVTANTATEVNAEQGEPPLVRARLALQERRLLAPAGDNAVEYYLQAQQDEATYSAARLALLELIAPATSAVESSIAAGQLVEAQRQYELLQRMGASELTLGPMRARMKAAQLEAERAEALADEPAPTTPVTEPTPPAATPSPAPAGPATSTAVTTAAPQPVAAPPVASAPVERPPAAPTVPPPVAPETENEPPAPAVAESAPAAASVQIEEPRQVVDVRPNYPAAAVQRRIEGWVELEIEIDTAGAVQGVSVVRSDPARVFDREATRAAQRWRFEPRRENGEAVASRVRKTLTFKLGAG